MDDDYQELTDLLRVSTPDDRAGLAKIIGIEGETGPEKTVDKLRSLRKGLLGRRSSGGYKQLVTDVADYVKIDWPALLRGRTWESLQSAEIEDAVVLKSFMTMYEKLSELDRRKLAEELGRAANDPNFITHLLAGGAMAAGATSGFQIYLLATTTLGAVTSALGLTLPFVAYTALTRGLSVALGPIGWAILGATVAFQLDRPNWSRLVPGVIFVSYIRHKGDA